MRQPLAAISLYVFGLKRLVQSGSMTPEKIEAIAGKLETQTARADAIVERVRAYAKSDKPVREAVKFGRGGAQGPARAHHDRTLACRRVDRGA